MGPGGERLAAWAGSRNRGQEMDAKELMQAKALMDAKELAEKSAAAMWAGDAASQALGMEIVSVGPGAATVRMRVRPDMVNGLGTCHGGLLFTLADSAFAFACNSYNQFAFAQHCTVSFIAPARDGDMLIATASEVSKAGRNGIYDVRIENAAGDLLALFRGYPLSVNGQHFEPGET